MTAQSFTRNYSDHSNDQGFQFEFHCDKCGNGYRSTFHASTLGLGQIEVLLNKFFVDKGALINNRNKYVLFWPLTEVEFEYFRSKAVPVLREKECFEELSDSQTLRYEQHIMIEKLYSLL